MVAPEGSSTGLALALRTKDSPLTKTLEYFVSDKEKKSFIALNKGHERVTLPFVESSVFGNDNKLECLSLDAYS